MVNKIKKILVITLVLFFCLTSLLSVSETAQGSDPQEELIKQVLTETGFHYGWIPGECFDYKHDGETFTYCTNFRPGEDSVELMIPVPECQRNKDVFCDEFLFLTVEIYPSEDRAKDRMEEFNRQTSSMENVKIIMFHGHQAIVDAGGMWGSIIRDEGVYWQAGSFVFQITGPPGCVDYLSVTKTLYTTAVACGLITGDGTIPVQDSDGDGVSDDIDQCPDTPAGVSVDASGCAIAKEMSLTVSTDKKAYSAGETVVIQGSVSDAEGNLAGAALIVDVNGTQLTATADLSGNYRCEFPIPDDISQGIYTVKATVSHSDYPSTSKSVSFVVGEIGIQLEENPVTGKPFTGIAADGVSSLRISISLPGCSNVKIGKPDVGELKGDAINFLGSVTLDSAGMAEITYYPPDYLTKDQLTRNLDVQQTNSKTWAAEVPLTLTYTDASDNEGKIESEILVFRPPVMLVHGFLGATATWGKMSTYLRGEKFDTYIGNYGATGQSIEGLSLILKNDIRKQKVDYANSNIKLAKVDIVGHSMGGLISRYYTHGLSGYDGDVRKLIMVGTPNHGVSWTKKITGNVGAGWYQTHRIPAGQLYSESSFMKTLNSGEKTGTHLNPDIQYGNIYGYPDDWVVSAASAYLNGVDYVTEPDVKHSPDIPVVPKVAITEYLKTWDQVKRWLNQDIYKPPLKGSRVEVYKYEGDVYLDEIKLTSSPAKFDSWHSLRTGKDSTAIVHLTINGRPWGVIFLDPESEIFLGYCSPQLVEVRLWKGSATFRSGKDGHFTVPVNIKRSEGGEWWKCNPQAVVTGQGTEFAVTAGENIEVHCLEGELVVDTPNATAINPALKDDFWWSTEDDHFLDSTPGGDWLGKFKDFIEGPFISNISVEVRKITMVVSEKLMGLYQMLPDNIRQMMPESISRNLLYIVLGFFVLILFLLIKILRGRR